MYCTLKTKGDILVNLFIKERGGREYLTSPGTCLSPTEPFVRTCPHPVGFGGSLGHILSPIWAGWDRDLLYTHFLGPENSPMQVSVTAHLSSSGCSSAASCLLVSAPCRDLGSPAPGLLYIMYLLANLYSPDALLPLHLFICVDQL
jgi:hypothetical protein